MTRAFLCCFLLSFVAIYALTFAWGVGNWAYYDQITYHIPYSNELVIRNFNPFGESGSATTPGAHFFYAGLAVLTGSLPLSSNSTLIPLAGSCVAALTISLLYAISRTLSGNWRWSPLLCLPVFSSQYFQMPSAYFVTEGLTYLLLALLFWVMSFRNNPRLLLILSSITVCGLVLVRQIYLPAGLVMLAVGLWRTRVPLMNYATIFWVSLPLIVFMPFFFFWNGLVPPEFRQHQYAGLNFLALNQSIALLGLLAIPISSELVTCQGSLRTKFIIAPLIVAAMLWVLGRYALNDSVFPSGSIIWTLLRYELSVTGTMFSMLILMVLGCVTLLHSLASKDNLISIAASGYVALSFALCFQNNSWQRYSEVFGLLLGDNRS